MHERPRWVVTKVRLNSSLGPEVVIQFTIAFPPIGDKVRDLDTFSVGRYASRSRGAFL